jgi:hypothetical protein
VKAGGKDPALQGFFTTGVLRWGHETLDVLDWAFDRLCAGDHHPGLWLGGGCALHPLGAGLRALFGSQAPACAARRAGGLAGDKSLTIALPTSTRTCYDSGAAEEVPPWRTKSNGRTAKSASPKKKNPNPHPRSRWAVARPETRPASRGKNVSRTHAPLGGRTPCRSRVLSRLALLGVPLSSPSALTTRAARGRVEAGRAASRGSSWADLGGE